MPRARRRSHTGIPLALEIAVLTAISDSRAGRGATPAAMPLPTPAVIAVSADGAIRTCFRPNHGEAHVRRPASHVPRGGP